MKERTCIVIAAFGVEPVSEVGLHCCTVNLWFCFGNFL